MKGQNRVNIIVKNMREVQFTSTERNKLEEKKQV